MSCNNRKRHLLEESYRNLGYEKVKVCSGNVYEPLEGMLNYFSYHREVVLRKWFK